MTRKLPNILILKEATGPKCTKRVSLNWDLIPKLITISTSPQSGILSQSVWNYLVKWSERCSVMSASLWPHGPYSLWNSPGQNTGVDNFSLLQGIFPPQGSNPGLPHCGLILYQLSHQGSPRILEWVAYPFSSRSSWPRNWTRFSCIAGGFFTNWAIREAPGITW